MFFTVDDEHFVSRHFVVHAFYGEKTCFCWSDNKLVVFPYVTNDSRSVQILRAPARIKCIQCYDSRIFLICSPQGVYKLSRQREFAVLSKSGVGMGSVFYEVLTPRNGYLYLDDKRTMSCTQLFQLMSNDSVLNNLCTYPLNEENADERLLQSMMDTDGSAGLCIIANRKKIFKLICNTVHIIHSSTYPVVNIVPVQKEAKTAGLLFLTDTDTVVFMHTRDNQLVFETVLLGTKVQAICAGFSQQMEDCVWIAYSDESKLYYAKKRLSSDFVQRMRVQDKSFTGLECYDTTLILGLTANKELLEFSTDTVERTLSIENDTFINLSASMLKGTEVVMEQIYNGIQRLHALNEILTNAQNKLRRINLYALKHRLHSNPKMVVHRVSNKLYLSVNLHDPLPKNSRIVLSAISNGAVTFCVKDVRDFMTVIDLCLPENNASDCPRLSMDLITVADEGKPWCLIRNYINDPPNERNRKKRSRIDKSNFINAKIAMLRNLIADGSTDMNKLSDIKRSIRREFGES